MAKQYFDTPDCASDRRILTLSALGVTACAYTDRGVFSVGELDPGTALLLSSLPPLSGRVLDLGCGWGPVGLLLLKRYPALSVTMSDVNERALSLCRDSLTLNGQTARVLYSDGLTAFSGETFSHIITNPPIRAGKRVIYRMFSDARACLADGGALYLVIRRQQGAESALKALRALYGHVSVPLRDKGYWVIHCRFPLPDAPSDPEM